MRERIGEQRKKGDARLKDQARSLTLPAPIRRFLSSLVGRRVRVAGGWDSRRTAIVMGLSLLSTSCGRAPSVDILGSFFPVWMLCLVIGVFLTFGLRILLLRTRMEADVGPLALFYPCAVILFTGLLWLIFFR